MATYDRIGSGYGRHRRPDPRIAEAIEGALGHAATVLNVGAGTGSYEPRDRQVVAVEPSMTMIGQRSANSAPVVQATAERLPFANDTFDLGMALLTIHHWTDWRAGVRELCRVAPRQVVWTFDAAIHNSFWLLRDYFPKGLQTPSVRRVPPIESVASLLGANRVEPVLVPADCTDLFGWASWRRPERYLDDEVCGATSVLAQLPAAELHAGQRRLADDLRSGRWHDRYGHLLELDAIDGGFRLIVAA